MAAERKKPWFEEPDVPLRVRQLVALRDLGVYGLNSGSATARERQFSEIDAAARQLPINKTEVSVFQRVKNLLSMAIQQLEDDSFAKATAILFRLASGYIGQKDTTHREDAAKVFDYPLESWRRAANGERLLFSLLDKAIDTAVETGRNHPDPANDYVERPELRTQFGAAVQADNGFILLYGEGGTGKTRAAIGLTRDLDCVVVRASQSELLHDDMAQALEDRGLSGSGDDGSVRRSFRRLLKGDRAPAYVVIDDIQSEQELRLYIPPEVRSMVIITSRLKMLPELPNVAFVKIGSLSEDQSLQLLGRFLPTASPTDMKCLHEVLGGRALAIKQAGAYLAEYKTVTVAEFVAAVQRCPTNLLNEIPDQTEVRLPLMYGQILAKVLTSSSVAARILKAITFTERTTIKQLLYRFAVPAVSIAMGSGSLEESVISRAFDLLANLCLIESEVAYDGTVAMVSIHPLTQEIFRQLLREQVDEICEEVRVASRVERAKIDEVRRAERAKVDRTIWRNPLEGYYANVVSELDYQYWEVARVRQECNPTDENKQQLDDAIDHMMGCILGGGAITLRCCLTDEQDIDFVRDAMFVLPPGLRPHYHSQVSQLMPKYIQAWEEKHRQSFLP